MNQTTDRLYDLLPAIHRLRDQDQGQPLRALLAVIAEQVNVVEKDIAQLYENWFIETCQDWVVPYIGDLIGYRQVHDAGEPGEVITAEGRLRNKILIPRREVANTIAYRRRKGTLALLESLSAAVAGWPARSVEFYRLLSVTQSINHLRLNRGRTADLRNGDALERLIGPFDQMAHTVDVRRINSIHQQGRYNIPSVGLFVWRLKAYPVTVTPAYCLEDVSPQSFTFSVLGNDSPLFNHPRTIDNPTEIASEIDVPAPIRRLAFDRDPAAYYGENKSFQIWIGQPRQPVPVANIIPADLSGWQYRPQPGTIAVDPELGRMVFPPGTPSRQRVWVYYNYGFSADIGGGEYSRTLSQPSEYKLYRVGEGEQLTRIDDALEQWKQDQPMHAVIEVTDSGVYVEQINIELAEGQSLQLRAANRKRPVIRLLDWHTDQPDSLSVKGGPCSRFTLDGMLITGRGVEIEGDLNQVVIRHSTLVPGWGLSCDCEPMRPSEPSLEIFNTKATVVIEHSILGAIHVSQNEVQFDPVPISISDSILDATNLERPAIVSPDTRLAFANVTLVRVTVFGEVETHSIPLAENSIFMSRMCVARRQAGCMRFCYVPPGSRTPRRFECQPDLVEDAVQQEFLASHIDAAQRDALIISERLRVEPEFNSIRYGTPAYCQLAETTASEILTGADDDSEMGVFHDLFQAQRAANLRARLDEFTPAGTYAGLIYAN